MYKWSNSNNAPNSVNWHSIAPSADGTKLAAVITGGGIYTSTNSGVTWSNSNNAPNSVNWQSIASSTDGTKLVAVIIGGGIYTSTNSGITWSTNNNAPKSVTWQSVASSADGTKLVAVINGGGIYTSNDSGITWSTNNNAPNSVLWWSVASSADGTKLAAVINLEGIYTSNDSGITWIKTNAINNPWICLASSADGSRLVASAATSTTYTSSDSGNTWILRNSAQRFSSLACSSDGIKIFASVSNNGGGLIYTSTDSGITWIPQISFAPYNCPIAVWTCIASNDNGTKLIAGIASGPIYTANIITILDYTYQDNSYNNIYILNNSNIAGSITVPLNDYLLIPKLITNVVVNPGVIIDNCGTIINYGTIDISANAAIKNETSGIFLNEFSGIIANDSNNTANINAGRFINRGLYNNELSTSRFKNTSGGVFKNKNGGIFDNSGIFINEPGAVFDNYYNFLRDHAGGQIINYGQYINDIIYGPGTTIVPSYNVISAGLNHSLAINQNGDMYAWGDNSSLQLSRSVKDASSNKPTMISLNDINYKSDILFITYLQNASAPLANYTIDISYSNPSLTNVYKDNFKNYSIINSTSASLSPSPSIRVTTTCNTITSFSTGSAKLLLTLDISNTPFDTFNYLLNKTIKIGTYNTINPIIINGNPYLQEIDNSDEFQLVLPTNATGTLNSGDIFGIVQYIHTINTSVPITPVRFTITGFSNTDISLNSSRIISANNTSYTNAISGDTVFDLSLNNSIVVNLPSGGAAIKVGLSNLVYGIPVDLSSNNIPVIISWIDVEAGGNRSFGLSTDSSNNIYAWGENLSNNLGLGSFYNTIPLVGKPTQIFPPISYINPTWINLKSGLNHALALDNKNKLYTWGDNSYGQLGGHVTNNTSILISVDLSPDISSNYIVPSNGSLNLRIIGQNATYTGLNQWVYKGGIGASVEYTNYPVTEGSTITIKSISGGSGGGGDYDNGMGPGGNGYMVLVNGNLIAVAGGGGGGSLLGNGGNAGNNSLASAMFSYSVGDTAPGNGAGGGGGGNGNGAGGAGGIGLTNVPGISNTVNINGVYSYDGGAGTSFITNGIGGNGGISNRYGGGGGGGGGYGGGGGGGGGAYADSRGSGYGGGGGGSYVKAGGSITTNTGNLLPYMHITVPINVVALHQISIYDPLINIACGNNHSFAIDIYSNLWSWGNNSNGQLGLGLSPTTYPIRNYPTQVTDPDPSKKWIKVAGGANHSLGLKSDGSLYSWGDNTFKQLGLGSTVTDLSRNVLSKITTPALEWIDIAADGNVSMALSNTNNLYVWGSYIPGQLGILNVTSNINVPTIIPGVNFYNFCVGTSHSLGIKNDNNLYAWGTNNYGQLGVGNNSIQQTPTEVTLINPILSPN